MTIRHAGLLLGALFAPLSAAQPGGLDSTFGTDGVAVVNLGIGEWVSSVAIQPDGRIVAAGGFNDPVENRYRPLAARFLDDGSLDPSFGVDGWTPSEHFGYAWVVALSPDGAIVAAGAGIGTSDGSIDFGITRFLPGGGLDSTFGDRGSVHTDFSGRWDRAIGIAIQADGRVVAGGSTFDPDAGGGTDLYDLALARYHPDGTLDETFGSGGRVRTDFTRFERPWGMALQSDGKILLAGVTDGVPANHFFLVRYLSTGALDPGFGIGGRVATLIGAGGGADAVALQPDGKIVVAGVTASPPVGVLALARYNADGTLDATFGAAGITETSVQSISNGIAIQPDGRILVAGHHYRDRRAGTSIVRFLPDGELDPSFGDGGISPVLDADLVGPTGIALDDTGRALVVRGHAAYSTEIRLVRFLTAHGQTPAEPAPVGSAPMLLAYPNPAGVGTAVRFRLERAQTARLALHDALGREVAVLLDGTRPRGTHEVAVDASNLPSGTYLLRLRTPDGVATRRVTIAR